MCHKAKHNKIKTNNKTSITFNLTMCTRHAKNDTKKVRRRWAATSCDKGEALTEGREKPNETVLVLRLFYDSKPWLVVNENMKEIVKSPICVPIVEQMVNEKRVKVYLRDFAGRGNDDCIKRLFTFHFHLPEEADSFQYSFNRFFHRWYKSGHNHTSNGEAIASPNLHFYHANMDEEESPNYVRRLREEAGLSAAEFDPTIVNQGEYKDQDDYDSEDQDKQVVVGNSPAYKKIQI